MFCGVHFSRAAAVLTLIRCLGGRFAMSQNLTASEIVVNRNPASMTE
jgi:hypothetical protein